MLTTVFAFLVAIGILIAVHEWGHYRMALACGVKVLRLSIGFGPVVLSYISPKSGIEYTLGLLPLGGYVRMLDEREAPVPPELQASAFNRQPLHKRALVVAAGPFANLVLAVALYAGVGMYGVEQASPILSSPPPGSLAQAAGVRAGDRVRGVSVAGSGVQEVRSFEELRWILTQAALSGSDVVMWGESSQQQWELPLSSLQAKEFGPQLFGEIGVLVPFSLAVIGDLVPGEEADKSGLRVGDRVMSVDGVAIHDAAHLRSLIRLSANSGQSRSQVWLIKRQEGMIEVRVRPRVVHQDGQTFGRVGASIGTPVERLLVRVGWWEGIARGVQRTWEISELTVRTMARMLVGEASLRNLSGPISVADYAGKSASSGWVHYVMFLAMVSISLGILNLFPIPMLDGGHLMYYLWEWLTGAPPSDRWLDGLQRAGVAILAAMMCIAVWNDVTRLLL